MSARSFCPKAERTGRFGHWGQLRTIMPWAASNPVICVWIRRVLGDHAAPVCLFLWIVGRQQMDMSLIFYCASLDEDVQPGWGRMGQG